MKLTEHREKGVYLTPKELALAQVGLGSLVFYCT